MGGTRGQCECCKCQYSRRHESENKRALTRLGIKCFQIAPPPQNIFLFFFPFIYLPLMCVPRFGWLYSPPVRPLDRPPFMSIPHIIFFSVIWKLPPDIKAITTTTIATTSSSNHSRISSQTNLYRRLLQWNGFEWDHNEHTLFLFCKKKTLFFKILYELVWMNF